MKRDHAWSAWIDGYMHDDSILEVVVLTDRSRLHDVLWIIQRITSRILLVELRRINTGVCQGMFVVECLSKLSMSFAFFHFQLWSFFVIKYNILLEHNSRTNIRDIKFNDFTAFWCFWTLTEEVNASYVTTNECCLFVIFLLEKDASKRCNSFNFISLIKFS